VINAVVCDIWRRFSMINRLIVVTVGALQGHHSPGKHGKVRELDNGQGKVRENVKSQRKL